MILRSCVFIFIPSTWIAAFNVTEDHHLSVDAAGSTQPLNPGSHLMRKVVPHESLPIGSNEFGGLLELEDVNELEFDEETETFPTLYYKTANKKKNQNDCQVKPASTPVTSGGGAGTWHSASSFRYQQWGQCKTKCTADTCCECFELHKNRTPKRCDFKSSCTGLTATPTSGDTSYDFYRKITASAPYAYTVTANKKTVGYAHTSIRTTVDPSGSDPVVSTGGTTSSKAGTAGRWRYDADGSTISSYYYSSINDCKIYCSGMSDCLGFNNHKSPSKEIKFCKFLTNTGNQSTATNVDVLVRR